MIMFGVLTPPPLRCNRRVSECMVLSRPCYLHKRPHNSILHTYSLVGVSFTRQTSTLESVPISYCPGEVGCT